MSVEEFDRLAPLKPQAQFVALMESLHLDGLDLVHEPDRGGDISFGGWLLDTNVVAALINPQGVPSRTRIFSTSAC